MAREKTWTENLGWLAAGAAACYLFDGVSGRRRRRRAVQKLLSMERQAETSLGRGVRDLAHRAQGAAAELGAGLRSEHPDDQVVAGRVRSRIGRMVARPHAVASKVIDGHVVLTGNIADGERDSLVAGLLAVRGVRGVEDHELQELEGAEGRQRRITRFRTPGIRLLAGSAGVLLAAWARRRSRVLELLGLALLARALRGERREAFVFHKTLHVHAPVDAVFHFFSDFRNFPRFMTHVRQVRILDGDRSLWVVEGPAGVPVEWVARVTELDPNRTLAWQSEPGSAVTHEGRVQLFPEEGGTRLELQLAYRPPAGALGHAVAALFGRDPKREMDDDLLRFKSLLEEGKARGRGPTVRREDLLH
jgi:uncharacterized membrane protein